MKLYIYEHCPFCARVRYVAGILGIDLDINVLEYHDENTPTSLIGKKSVPILLKGNKATTESMEIIADVFQLTQTFDAKQVSQAVLDWQKAAFPLLQQIGYPRWANLPLQEFKSELSRTEWKRKKESDTLNFSELLENTNVIVKTVNTLIEEAVQLLNFQNGNPTLSSGQLHQSKTIEQSNFVRCL